MGTQIDRRVCSAEEHDLVRAAGSLRNLREQDSGDPHIRLVIGECPNCPSTLGLEEAIP